MKRDQKGSMRSSHDPRGEESLLGAIEMDAKGKVFFPSHSKFLKTSQGYMKTAKDSAVVNSQAPGPLYR